jgi:hypothetical protein
MFFAQLNNRESICDVETCLRAVGTKLYHAGIRSRVSRSTLTEANERRPWLIYHDLAQHESKENRFMGKKGHTVESIVAKLREAEVLMAKGQRIDRFLQPEA